MTFDQSNKIKISSRKINTAVSTRKNNFVEKCTVLVCAFNRRILKYSPNTVAIFVVEVPQNETESITEMEKKGRLLSTVVDNRYLLIGSKYIKLLRILALIRSY